jgi:hypothetical protein
LLLEGPRPLFSVQLHRVVLSVKTLRVELNSVSMIPRKMPYEFNFPNIKTPKPAMKKTKLPFFYG